MRLISSSISSRPTRIETVCRLVQEHQLGIVHDRLSQLYSLFHAGREPLDQPVALFVETDLIEHVSRPLPRGTSRHPAHLRHVRDEIGGGGVVWKGVRLRHVANPHPQLATIRHGVATQYPRASAVWPRKPEQNPEQRRFPGPVRPQQTDRRPRHGEIDVIESNDGPVALHESRRLDAQRVCCFPRIFFPLCRARHLGRSLQWRSPIVSSRGMWDLVSAPRSFAESTRFLAGARNDTRFVAAGAARPPQTARPRFPTSAMALGISFTSLVVSPVSRRV